MNFTKFDMSILIVMTLAVVIMSFTFPALGLSGSQVNETDMPRYNISTSMFNFAGDFPDRPNTATSGQLEYSAEQGNSIEGVNLQWLDRPKDTGYSLELQNTSTNGFDVVFINYTSTSSTVHRYDITGTQGQEILIQQEGWVITVTIDSIENYGQSNMTATATWEIESDPDSSSGISSIPIIGNIADGVANVLGFIAVVITWLVFTTIEILVNVVVALFVLVQYLFGMAYFLISTYGAIVAGAPGWASVILTIPGVILFAEFAKITAIVISLLPTT